MVTEVLRLEHIKSNFQTITNLDDFNLRVNEGEVIGLVKLNDVGMDAFLRLLQKAEKLRKGRIYWNEKLSVSQYFAEDSIVGAAVISSKSRLIEELSVFDNIFLTGNRKTHNLLIPQKRNRLQFRWMVAEYGLDIKANRKSTNLPTYIRCIIEIMRAMVREQKLIVMNLPKGFLTNREWDYVLDIMRRLKNNGMSFIIISNNYEETDNIADKIIYFRDGRDIKIFNNAQFNNFFKIKNTVVVNKATNDYGKPLLMIKNLWTNHLCNLSLQIYEGELLIIKANLLVQNDLISILRMEHTPHNGEIYLNGKNFLEEKQEKIFPLKLYVIKESPLKNMIFYKLSYRDNLFMGMEKKLGQHIWHANVADSMFLEIKNLNDKRKEKYIDELSEEDLYDLVYYHVLLLKPEIVFIVQPFSNTDDKMRRHVESLIDLLKKAGITICMLTTNITNSMGKADRVVEIHNSRIVSTYHKEEFSEIMMRV